MKIKQDKGITLVALVITVIILAILAGISMNIGLDLINTTKLETLKTNMLLIQAKAKEYVEEANFKLGTNTEISDDVKNELKGTEQNNKDEIANLYNINIDNNCLCYKLEKQDLLEMGLSNIETTNSNYYIVIYDIKNITVEVINTVGYRSKDNTIHYTLSDLNTIEE